MSNEFNATKRVFKEVLIDLMTERVTSMCTGVQASSTIGLQASPSTARGLRPCRPSVEKRTKHKDDLANVKLSPSIFPNYSPPLAGAVNHDSVPRYFEYAMVSAYLQRGYTQLEQSRVRSQH
jgi:hypothetical protein